MAPRPVRRGGVRPLFLREHSEVAAAVKRENWSVVSTAPAGIDCWDGRTGAENSTVWNAASNVSLALLISRTGREAAGKAGTWFAQPSVSITEKV